MHFPRRSHRDARAASRGLPAPAVRWARCSVAVSLALALSPAGDLQADEPPVSWYRDITPIFKRSCNGCHNPNKLKGDVDTSSHAGLLKPGKHGPNLRSGDPEGSLVLEQIRGAEPDMPKEGDPLSAAEIALIARWIREGALDDTPASARRSRPETFPEYQIPPVTTALAVSPDGHWIAASGHHEVFLLDAATLETRFRLLGESPRIEALAFSPDSSRLAACGGAPSQFGEVQVWASGTTNLLSSWTVGTDSVYGVSWSPDGTRLALGGADKSVRILDASDGREQIRFDNHSDWVFRTAWMAGGSRLLSAGRDRAMKLLLVSDGQFIDDVNKLIEPVVSMARHPSEEWAACGGAEGGLRLYRARENQERTAGNNDVNLVREFERQPGAVAAVAFSPDGSLLAAGGPGGEVRVYRTGDGTLAARLPAGEGAIYALAFTTGGQRLITGGFDGLIRCFDPVAGTLEAVLTPVPLSPARTVVHR